MGEPGEIDVPPALPQAAVMAVCGPRCEKGRVESRAGFENAARLFTKSPHIPSMTVIESIVRDLSGMPMRKLVEVARYVHRLSETVERERADVLRETHGYLSDEDARIFEQALENSRRSEARG